MSSCAGIPYFCASCRSYNGPFHLQKRSKKCLCESMRQLHKNACAKLGGKKENVSTTDMPTEIHNPNRSNPEIIHACAGSECAMKSSENVTWTKADSNDAGAKLASQSVQTPPTSTPKSGSMTEMERNYASRSSQASEGSSCVDAVCAKADECIPHNMVDIGQVTVGIEQDRMLFMEETERRKKPPRSVITHLSIARARQDTNNSITLRDDDHAVVNVAISSENQAPLILSGSNLKEVSVDQEEACVEGNQYKWSPKAVPSPRMVSASRHLQPGKEGCKSPDSQPNSAQVKLINPESSTDKNVLRLPKEIAGHGSSIDSSAFWQDRKQNSGDKVPREAFMTLLCFLRETISMNSADIKEVKSWRQFNAWLTSPAEKKKTSEKNECAQKEDSETAGEENDDFRTDFTEAFSEEDQGSCTSSKREATHASISGPATISSKRSNVDSGSGSGSHSSSKSRSRRSSYSSTSLGASYKSNVYYSSESSTPDSQGSHEGGISLYKDDEVRQETGSQSTGLCSRQKTADSMLFSMSIWHVGSSPHSASSYGIGSHGSSVWTDSCSDSGLSSQSSQDNFSCCSWNTERISESQRPRNEYSDCDQVPREGFARLLKAVHEVCKNHKKNVQQVHSWKQIEEWLAAVDEDGRVSTQSRSILSKSSKSASSFSSSYKSNHIAKSSSTTSTGTTNLKSSNTTHTDQTPISDIWAENFDSKVASQSPDRSSAGSISQTVDGAERATRFLHSDGIPSAQALKGKKMQRDGLGIGHLPTESPKVNEDPENSTSQANRVIPKGLRFPSKYLSGNMLPQSKTLYRRRLRAFLRSGLVKTMRCSTTNRNSVSVDDDNSTRVRRSKPGKTYLALKYSEAQVLDDSSPGEASRSIGDQQEDGKNRTIRRHMMRIWGKLRVTLRPR